MKSKKQKFKQVELQIDTVKQDIIFDWLTVFVLLVIGVYQSFILFGHKVVPISDFPTIILTGHEILEFKCPSTFKMAPLTGMLQIAFGKIAGGRFPDLKGGWLLNATLHPLNLILFWLIGKKIIGKTAIWFAIICAMTPWVLYMLREPLVETPLLFFVLLTTYLIYRRTSWAYLAASMATMVRYESAALIFAAFVMDMIYKKTKKEKLIAFGYSAFASVPLGLWLWGTFLHSDTLAGHYFSVFTKEYGQNFSEPVENRTGIIKHLELIWNVGFRPLFIIDPASSREAFDILWAVSKFMASTTFIFGAIYGLLKKNWQILVLLIFFVPYFLLHAYYPYPIPRFHSTIFWIALLISLFGLKQFWLIVKDKLKLPIPMIRICQIAVLFIAVLSIIPLVSYLNRLTAICQAVKYLPFVVIFAFVLIVLVMGIIYKAKYIFPNLATAAVMVLIVLSSQFSIAPLLGDGKQDVEFKYLADWFVDNAKSDEKMAVYMVGVVKIFAPEIETCFVGFPSADSPQELVEKLRQERITYVVWASREGLSRDHYGYHKQKLDTNIPFLAAPKDNGPYKFVTQIKRERGLVNIFRLE